MKNVGWISALWETLSSVLPLTLILVIIQIAIFKKPMEDVRRFGIGFLFTVLGLHLFLAGVEMSLIPLGDQVGRNFVLIERKWVILVMAFVIGYFATLVEPGLKALAFEVEEVSAGAIPNKVLIHGVAIGFASGMVIGLSRIIYNVSYLKVLLPLLIVVTGLSIITPVPFDSIAFDAASATTGPVNIPINMALAVGLASVIEGVDPLLSGFGVVGLTSVVSMISVMILGILTKI